MKVRMICLLALAAVAQGCGVFGGDAGKCHERSEYQDATPGPRLRVPDDLESLPHEARLEIPYGEINTESTPFDVPCLVEPPSYEDRSPN
ncbi:MAG: hypothetical protein QF790_02570 [Gammaproteobacteria bacterium]|jgi:uncharacterized lipoprotein|nr:hypothetical protein [Gammaproteobacteria bacterium]MDP6616032.1 hypothetical protein [Gammaproteobacteria bacterium]MDP6695493.1 hypothetical protein [Gammaproteobacteria bacterium]